MVENSKNNKKRKDEVAIERGLRLKKIIVNNFGSQMHFAEVVNVKTATINNYVSGWTKINDKFAMKCQDIAGINANYLLNGVEPMMLSAAKPDKPHEVKFVGGILPVEQELVNERNIKSSIRGMLDQLTLSNNKRKDLLKATGKVEVLDIVINGIQKPFLLSITSDNMKRKYNLNNGTYFVMNAECCDGDLVLVNLGREFILAEFLEDGTLIEIEHKKVIQKDDKIEIIGAVYSKIEMM